VPCALAAVVGPQSACPVMWSWWAMVASKPGIRHVWSRASMNFGSAGSLPSTGSLKSRRNHTLAFARFLSAPGMAAWPMSIRAYGAGDRAVTVQDGWSVAIVQQGVDAQREVKVDAGGLARRLGRQAIDEQIGA
jgi:hypothetical protein